MPYALCKVSLSLNLAKGDVLAIVSFIYLKYSAIPLNIPLYIASISVFGQVWFYVSENELATQEALKI